MSTRIVVAPDSFKESMTAVQASRAMAAGVRDSLPMCLVDQVPVSDGGEGFAEAVSAAWGALWRAVATVDALGRPRTAGFGLDGDRAVIDLASSVGLEHIVPDERDVIHSSTIGLGHVIAASVDAGARSLLIGLGGWPPTTWAWGCSWRWGPDASTSRGTRWNRYPPSSPASGGLRSSRLAVALRV